MSRRDTATVIENSTPQAGTRHIAVVPTFIRLPMMSTPEPLKAVSRVCLTETLFISSIGKSVPVQLAGHSPSKKRTILGNSCFPFGGILGNNTRTRLISDRPGDPRSETMVIEQVQLVCPSA